MTDRKYTIAEIDAMRDAIKGACSGAYMPAERAADIENRLRTYLTAGIDPEDLINTMKLRQAANQEAQQRQFVKVR